MIGRKHMKENGVRMISEMLEIHGGEITEYVKKNHVDVAVNAANPTLMGSDYSGVDYEIHKVINKGMDKKQYFKDKIREELDEEKDYPEDIIRCERGKAVTTSGYTLCKYVIHVVGPKCDGKKENGKRAWCCTSKCTKVLESCYCSIMEEIKNKRDINTVAIPIIGSGNYGIPFELAVRIAIGTVGNILTEWKNEDSEYFQYMSLKKVVFCIYDSDVEKQNDLMHIGNRVLEQYDVIFTREHRVVYQTTWQAQCRQLYEIIKYDETKGYFSVAKAIRCFLAVLRMLFLPVLGVKDVIGKYDWHVRRKVAEWITFGKVLLPFIGVTLVHIHTASWHINKICAGIIIYSVLDTVTYLVALMLLADIQGPSANVIRSMILLLVNYVEVSLDMALLFYLDNLKNISFKSALSAGVMGDMVQVPKGIAIGQYAEILNYTNQGIKFFFMTLAFGYFADHLKQRKFRS